MNCPRCHQAVDPRAIACPFCRTPLKAYGHPGIPLYRATGEEYLCDSCIYHEDDSCNFPQRPYAQDCTLYHHREQPLVAPTYRPSAWAQVQLWARRNMTLLGILVLLGVSLAIALAQR
ncbi:MAG TPA: zinc ribbon domain-containing protein [Synechococcales cyanobacterium M55_K2018_004]|nr:zinc ribbon domain-containing protein [Synechococcales cyanobacterium M55_K2018_004]